MRPEDYERVQRELHRLQSNPRLPVEQQLRLAQGAFLLAMQHDTLLREPHAAPAAHGGLPDPGQLGAWPAVH